MRGFRVALVSFLCLLSAFAAHAQSCPNLQVPFIANGIHGLSGPTLANGTAELYATDASDNPINFNDSQGIVSLRRKSLVVTAGNIPTFCVPKSDATPKYVYYHFTAHTPGSNDPIVDMPRMSIVDATLTNGSFVLANYTDDPSLGPGQTILTTVDGVARGLASAACQPNGTNCPPAVDASARQAASAACQPDGTNCNGTVRKSGDTMQGSLSLAADPTSDMQAATKRYVDANAGSGGGSAAGQTFSIQSRGTDGKFAGDSSLLRDASGDFFGVGYHAFGSVDSSRLQQLNPGGGAGDCRSSTLFNSNAANGSGRSNCFDIKQTINGYGRNAGGAVPGGTAGNWQVSHGLLLESDIYAAGIGEALTLVCNKTGSGDLSCVRMFDNFIPGAKVDGSAESKKMFYLASTPITPYQGKVTAGLAGASTITTSKTGGCTGGQNAPTICIGAQMPVLRTTAPLYSGNVTAITTASLTTYGTMTVDNTLIPSVAFGTLSAGLPDTTNFAAGSTVTATFTVTSGTPAASGIACVAGSQANLAETLNYSISGNTVTLSGHRYPQGTLDPVANPIYIVFGNSCAAFVPTIPATTDGQKYAWWIIGALDSHTLAYVSYRTSDRRDNNLATGYSGFTAGVAGRDGFNVYGAAVVVAAFNPATGPGSPPDGTMQLAVNDVPWSPNDTVEQAIEPAYSYNMMNTFCSPGASAQDGLATCLNISASDDVNRVVDLIVNDTFSKTSAGFKTPIGCLYCVRTTSTTYGGYTSLLRADIPPLNGGALLSVGGCMAGNSSIGCPINTGNYFVFRDDAGGGSGIQYDRPSNTLSVSTRLAVFNMGYRSTSGLVSNSGLLDSAGLLGGSNLDQVVGNPNLMFGFAGYTAAPDGNHWSGTYQSTGLSRFGGVASGFHPSNTRITPVSHFQNTGTITYRYAVVPVFPSGAVGTTLGLFIAVNNAPALDSNDFVTIPCPSSVELGYPTGTTYKLVVVTAPSLWRDLGTCAAGATITDDGTVSAGVMSGVALYSYPGSADNLAYRQLAAPNGVIGFVPDSSSTTPDAAISRGGAGVLSVGNGTPGDSSGTLQAAKLRSGSSSVAVASLSSLLPAYTTGIANGANVSSLQSFNTLECNGISFNLASPFLGQKWDIINTSATTACTVNFAGGIGNTTTSTSLSISSGNVAHLIYNGSVFRVE